MADTLTMLYSALLVAAHETLNPFVSDWVFSGNKAAKDGLLRAYRDLNPRLKAQLAEEIRTLVHGKIVVYRSVRPGQPIDQMGGMSVTDKLSTRTGDVHSWEIDPDDIMLHYKQQDSWLSSRAYAHEQEIILRPDARPKYLGPVGPEARVARRWAGRSPLVGG